MLKAINIVSSKRRAGWVPWRSGSATHWGTLRGRITVPAGVFISAASHCFSCNWYLQYQLRDEKEYVSCKHDNQPLNTCLCIFHYCFSLCLFKLNSFTLFVKVRAIPKAKYINPFILWYLSLLCAATAASMTQHVLCTVILPRNGSAMVVAILQGGKHNLV